MAGQKRVTSGRSAQAPGPEFCRSLLKSDHVREDQGSKTTTAIKQLPHTRSDLKHDLQCGFTSGTWRRWHSPMALSALQVDCHRDPLAVSGHSPVSSPHCASIRRLAIAAFCGHSTAGADQDGILSVACRGTNLAISAVRPEPHSAPRGLVCQQ